VGERLDYMLADEDTDKLELSNKWHDLVRAARLKERERIVSIMRKYLVFQSQRAVSWHEIQDCIDEIEGRRK
jgi:hypothetical protein